MQNSGQGFQTQLFSLMACVQEPKYIPKMLVRRHTYFTEVSNQRGGEEGLGKSGAEKFHVSGKTGTLNLLQLVLLWDIIFTESITSRPVEGR